MGSDRIFKKKGEISSREEVEYLGLYSYFIKNYIKRNLRIIYQDDKMFGN